jgi:hypothetical protein
MGANCSRCGVRLFGAELERGVCENCQSGVPASHPLQRERGYEADYRAAPASSSAEHGIGLDLAWKPVYTGLRLQVAGLVAVVVSFALGLVLMAAMIIMGVGLGVQGSGAESGMAALGCLGTLGSCVWIAFFAIALILFAVGSFFFVACPPVGRLRLYALLNVVCLCSLILVPVLSLCLVRYVPRDASIPVFIALWGSQLLAWLGSLACFFAFLRGVARYFGRAHLATQFLIWPLIYCGLIAFSVATMIVGELITAQGDIDRTTSELERSASAVLMGGFVWLLVLGLVIWLLVLVERLRTVVRGSLPQSAIEGE